VWAISADDNDEELLDEDALLTEADLQRPALPPSEDDCEARFGVLCSLTSTARRLRLTRRRRCRCSQVGAAGRKACANCTCGRAEAGTKVVVADAGSDAGVPMPASACGSVRARAQ
jgi:hypothetical protein